MSESKIQKKVIDKLKSLGAYVIKTIKTNRNGTPDVLACKPVKITPEMVGLTIGVFVACEVKRPGENPDPLQVYHLEQIGKAGGVAFRADCVDDLEFALKTNDVQS